MVTQLRKHCVGIFARAACELAHTSPVHTPAHMHHCQASILSSCHGSRLLIANVVSGSLIGLSGGRKSNRTRVDVIHNRPFFPLLSFVRLHGRVSACSQIKGATLIYLLIAQGMQLTLNHMGKKKQ